MEGLQKEIEELRSCLQEVEDTARLAYSETNKADRQETRLSEMETRLSNMEATLSDIKFRLTAAEGMINVLTSGPSMPRWLASKPNPAVNAPTAPANKPKPTVGQTAPVKPQ